MSFAFQRHFLPKDDDEPAFGSTNTFVKTKDLRLKKIDIDHKVDEYLS